MADREPEFFTVDDVKDGHAEGLRLFGGTEGIRDEGALEAAVMQAEGTFDGVYLHEDIFSMAAAYGYHISQAQAFLDGNKRAAVYAMIGFLDINGFRVSEHGDILYLAILEVATGTRTKWQLGDLLRQLAGIVELPGL